MPNLPSRFLLPATLAIAALGSLSLLTGCGGVLGTNIATSSPTRATVNITGAVHGGQSPISASLVQLWETGGGVAGSSATATATVGTGANVGKITAVTLTNPGSGYTTAPTVSFTDNTGTGASATATLSASDGTIASINVTAGGSGYTAPVVVLSGGLAPNGYGKGAIQLIASTTSAVGTGSFSFPTANVAANCQTGPFTYITATGGDSTGLTNVSTNSAIEMVAVIGACNSTGSTTNVIVNELTTVAAAYSLSNFATDSSGTINIGAPLTNSQGLSDAVANTALLVNPVNGTANASTATTILPTAMINTLGNALAACINTTSSTSTACGNLFTYTTPTGTGAPTPTDTFQAAVNMAKYPGSNAASVLNLGVGSGAPFVNGVTTTTVSTTTAPNDLTLAISYRNPTLELAAYNTYVNSPAINGPVGFTIDSSDNVWSVGATNGSLDTSHYNYVSELSNPTSGPTYTSMIGTNAALDATHTIRTAAFDTLGNLWLSDKNATGGSLIEIASGMQPGAATELTSFTGITLTGGGSLDPNDWWVAIDASNSLWTASYGGAGNCTTATAATVCDYVEYVKGGTVTTPTYTPTATFGASSAQENVPTSRGGIVDTTSASIAKGLGNVWATAYGVIGGSTAGTAVEVLTPSSGALSTITIGTTATRPQGIALDASGNGWVTTNATAATSGLWLVPQGTANGSSITSVVSTSGQASLTTIPTTTTSPASTATTAVPVGGISSPGYDAVDGAGNIWVANRNYGTVVQYSPTLLAYLSPYYGFSPSLTTSPAATYTAAQVTLFYSSSINQANIYAPNNISVGQNVTLSGFTGTYACMNGGPFPVTALGATVSSYIVVSGLSSTCGNTTVSKAAAVGTITVASSNQAVFTCSGTSTVTCNINTGLVPSNTYISVDRAGTVWTMPQNGTLTGIIGTAAPTNPVLANPSAGMLP